MLKFFTSQFETYIEVNPNEEEHLVQVRVSGSISSHSGVSDITIESIFSLDADQEVLVKNVSINDMKRLMELAEETLLTENYLTSEDDITTTTEFVNDHIDKDSYQDWLVTISDKKESN